MATAADIVVAKTEQIVPVGEIEPENIHTPCYVDDLVQATLSVEDLGSSAFVKNRSKKDMRSE